MSFESIIVMSPSSFLKEEPQLINQLFDLGIQRYHISKDNATEQSIAEILKDVNPKFLNKITLHSHFHLVLAYGVGGIHYSELLKNSLGDDFIEKIKLYQGFGIEVSGEGKNSNLNYFINSNNQVINKEGVFQLIRIPELEILSLNAIMTFINLEII